MKLHRGGGGGGGAEGVGGGIDLFTLFYITKAFVQINIWCYLYCKR